MNAHDGAGFASLRDGNGEAAAAQFRSALALFPEHARSLVGLGAALTASGDAAGAATAFAGAETCIASLRRGGRASEATLAGSTAPGGTG
jgi:Flp pilus assembly protein TadD